MFPHEERELDIVQVTVNNSCNLTCPHCYLNVAGKGVISFATIEKIFECPPAKVAIVGMEPLHDPDTVSAVKEIIRRSKETETYVSLVTNGLGLKHLLEFSELPDLIDISLDAGPQFYHRFRGGGRDLFPNIAWGAKKLVSAHSEIEVNILHTLFAENTKPEIIKDMVVGGREISPKGQILFSPFIPPNIEIGLRGTTSCGLALEELFSILRGTRAFMDEPTAFFFAGPYNAAEYGLSFKEMRQLVVRSGLKEKSRLDESVPHKNGSIRVTFDGFAIRPDYSVHTALYKKHKRSLDRPLVAIYRDLAL